MLYKGHIARYLLTLTDDTVGLGWLVLHAMCAKSIVCSGDEARDGKLLSSVFCHSVR